MKIVIKLITVHKYKCTIHRKTFGHNSPSGSIKRSHKMLIDWSMTTITKPNARATSVTIVERTAPRLGLRIQNKTDAMEM